MGEVVNHNVYGDSAEVKLSDGVVIQVRLPLGLKLTRYFLASCPISIYDALLSTANLSSAQAMLLDRTQSMRFEFIMPVLTSI